MTDDPYREGRSVNRVGAKRDFTRNPIAIALRGSLMSVQGPSASAAGEAEAGWQLDRRWVWAWLDAPHPPMPNMNLSRSEIDDVIAYLDTLAKH